MADASRMAKPFRYDLATLTIAGWLLVLSTAVLLALGIFAVGVLMNVPKRISPVQWAACIAVLLLSLGWFQLGKAALGRCGVPIHRGKSLSKGVRDGDDFA